MGRDGKQNKNDHTRADNAQSEKKRDAKKEHRNERQQEQTMIAKRTETNTSRREL